MFKLYSLRVNFSRHLLLKFNYITRIVDKLHVYTKYEDAHQVIKEFKNSRFKCFSTEAEASYFSRNGSSSGPGVPNVISESIPFKSLKRQDIYKFRRHIETQNFKSVETLVSENPRYLIGIGDTPTIMQVIAWVMKWNFYTLVKNFVSLFKWIDRNSESCFSWLLV